MKTPRRAVVQAISRRLAEAQASGRFDSKQFAEEIAAYLLAERRSGELDSIMRDVSQMRAQAGVVEVIAVSAFPLAPDAVQDITARVRSLYPQATEVIVSSKLDTSVVGGVRLEFPNQQLDLTVRAKLNLLKKHTVKGI